jgi:hypothetical protein
LAIDPILRAGGKRRVRNTLRRGFQEFELLTVGDRGSSGDVLSFPDSAEALHFLRGFLGDPLSVSALRDVLARESPHSGASRLRHREVLKRLSTLLVTGDLRIASLRFEPQPLPSAPAAEAPPEEEEQKAGVPVAPPVTEHWVQFKVIDDETDAPIDGVKIEVKLPDGRVETLETRGGGMAEVRGLDPGKCDVVRILDEEGLEVVSIG